MKKNSIKYNTTKISHCHHGPSGKLRCVTLYVYVAGQFTFYAITRFRLLILNARETLLGWLIRRLVLPEPVLRYTRLFHCPLYTVLTTGVRILHVTGVWKTVGIPTGHVSPQCNGALGNTNLYLDQPIAKAWRQPIAGHVSYPTDSPTASRLGLCSSLLMHR